METENVLLIGGIVVGGYFLYKSLGEGLKKTGDALGDITGAVGNVADTSGQALSSWIDLLNIKKDTDAIKTAFTGFNNYLATQIANQQNQSAQGSNNQDSSFIGARNINGDIIGIQPGVLGLSVLNKKSSSSGSSYSNSWLRITPTNTQNINGQTAMQAIQTAMNPYIQNVAITSGNSVLVNKKPVSLPPSLLSIVTGKY